MVNKILIIFYEWTSGLLKLKAQYAMVGKVVWNRGVERSGISQKDLEKMEFNSEPEKYLRSGGLSGNSLAWSNAI